eukprot:16439085-Heterocapsa_arctica.AAC.1
MILASVGGDGVMLNYYIVLSPDLYIFAENLGSVNMDLAVIHERPPDRSIPFGIRQGEVYHFAVLPT